MSDNVIWFIVGLILGAVFMLCIYKGYESSVEEENNELKKQLEFKDTTIDDLNRDLKRASEDISNLASLPKTVPTGCKEGAWCESCEFVKTYSARAGIFGYITKYYCGMEEACKNFVQVKGEK